jgi:hypothetical protein
MAPLSVACLISLPENLIESEYAVPENQLLQKVVE